MAGKLELVELVASGTGSSKTAAAAGIDMLFDAIKSITSSGERVSVKGFGSFEVKTRAARMGRNPQTGADIKIEEKHVLVFKAAK